VVESLTDGELTVLGLLAETPRHGYELERVVEQRGIRTWTALGFSSIYYLLDKLAKRGLIEATDTAMTGKSRATFRVTASGHQQLAAASRDALAVLTPIRARVLIGMANSPGLPDADVRAGLTRRRDALRQQLAEVRAARASQRPLPTAADAIFSYGEAMLEADLNWTEKTLTTLTAESTVDKYDIKKVHKALYAPSATKFTRVEVPELRYIVIDGHGDPNTAPTYAAAVEALYAVAYALKFASKNTLGRDFVVGPLEGLWRAEDQTVFIARNKDSWEWTMMISQPEWITEDMVHTSVESVSTKKGIAAARDIRLRTLAEGTCVQILHIGSYDDETPTLERLHNSYLPDHGLTYNGDHHEIYLSDARRTAPAKLKTILRQPVKPG
jgi:DNA-binding PadR family transcriptional regulator